MDDKSEIIEMTAEIVAAYVENNTLATADLPALIQSVHRALAGIATGNETVEATPKEPAVPIRRSITPDHLVCLEDGRKFKSLKRHLRTKYNMSPEDYRAKWGLAKDYPMVAPNYAKARSELAKQMGLGQGGRRRRRSPSASSTLRSAGVSPATVDGGVFRLSVMSGVADGWREAPALRRVRVNVGWYCVRPRRRGSWISSLNSGARPRRRA